LDRGLADVQREDDKVIITVGAGGAFASGSADLTPAAIDIMNRIAEVNAAGKSEIKVSGHTDDVPLIFGSNYRDNWDLAAARSASVVQAFAANGTISEDRLRRLAMASHAQLSQMTRPMDARKTAGSKSKSTISDCWCQQWHLRGHPETPWWF
jgi:chemotaxis protein MotB